MTSSLGTTPQYERKRVAILGCTGSVGSQALDVCRQHADKLQVVALSAHSNTKTLVAAAREFNVRRVAVTNEAHAQDPILSELPQTCSLSCGSHAAVDICLADDIDEVLVSIVGAAGLSASAAVLASGKQLALANKESLVVGGDLLMPMARPGQLLPVDSEHSAIFQCYRGEHPKEAHAIWLTCSGGPFLGKTRQELESVTVADALAHPTWSMGAKITIDSATLMNKGLERIEAMHLFHVDMDFIRVLVHRESKIHSMVEYNDGSVMAHLGASDMRIPIQYAFSFPNRWETPAERIDFRTLAGLSFDAPDTDTFRCLALADIAGKEGGTLPCVLNAANEIAVEAFLAGACSFTDIDHIAEAVMDKHVNSSVYSLDQLGEVDSWARNESRAVIAKLS